MKTNKGESSIYKYCSTERC